MYVGWVRWWEGSALFVVRVFMKGIEGMEES